VRKVASSRSTILVRRKAPSRTLERSPHTAVPSRRIVEFVAKAGTERGIASPAEDAEAVAIGATERDWVNVVGGEVGRLVRNPVDPWADMPVGSNPCVDERFPLAPACARPLSLPRCHAAVTPRRARSRRSGRGRTNSAASAPTSSAPRIPRQQDRIRQFGFSRRRHARLTACPS
jgi:hypothetical protein